MPRNKVYMNEPTPANWYERLLREHFDRRFDVRPLDGTNLEWIYKRDEPKVAHYQDWPHRLNLIYFADGDGTY